MGPVRLLLCGLGRLCGAHSGGPFLQEWGVLLRVVGISAMSPSGGIATIVPASDYVSAFRGEGVEPDLVALPVGPRFYVRGDVAAPRDRRAVSGEADRLLRLVR